MKSIGILGGTFDPIHNGHLYIAQEALNAFNLDKVIFVPGGNPPHKRDKNITSPSIRYELVKMAIREYPEFSISDYEINKKGYSYTYETLEHFKEKEENAQIYFITGADCLMHIYEWKNVHSILKLCNFVVFNRPGYSREEILKQKLKVENQYKKEILLLDLLNIEISSSYIRDKIKAGVNMEYFMPPAVYNTIITLKLYS